MSTPLRVLMVEDSRADAELLLRELKQGGYEPAFQRVDTPEAMKAALQDQAWDIIISDYVLPRFSGPAALKLVREMETDLPFIVVTGQVGEETAVETMKAGANDYILKGNLTRLVPAIQRELGEVEVRRERKRADEALQRAHEELRQAHTMLEQRVEERTRELADERQRLEITLRSIGDGVIATDVEGRVAVMNEVAEYLTGWSEEEGVGKPLAEVFHIINEQSRLLLTNPVEIVLKTGEIVGLANNTLLVAKDGAERIIADSAAPIRGADDNTAGVVLVFRDVTERKGAEQEREQLLRQIDSQRQLFQSVVENVPVGIALLRGPDFVFEIANPSYQAIAPGKELLGKTVAEAWPELASQVMPLLENVFRTGEPYSIKDAPLPLQRSPELPLEEAYFTFSYVPLRESDGQVSAILVLVVETTEQVHARQRIEELARAGERRSVELETIINSIADDVFIWDKEWQIVDVNEAALRFLGLGRKEEAINLSAGYLQKLNLRHLDGRPVAPEERGLARALCGEVVRDFEQVALDVHSGLDMYLLTSAAPIRDSTGNIVGAVVVNSDITRLKELDRLKDQFISTAAHELKTPLTLMKGYAQALLRTGGDLPPARYRMLEGIDVGADRINKIVNELLDITWLQQGSLNLEIQKVDLPELVKLVVDEMALTATKHRIQIVQADPAIVQGDRGRLEQVLVHLIDNATRFSPNGGDIDVSVRMQDHEAVVCVQDYGVSIPEDKKAHIFERFYHAHAGTPYDYSGMGVGLYISREIVARHGGRMWFESEEGKGSTFCFGLPLPKEQEAAQNEVNG